MHKVYCSSVLDQPVDQVWSMIRDFNNYPRYIEGVTESIIEDSRRGDEIGAVRRFRYGDTWIRQRLAAHSDEDRTYTYAGMEPFSFPAKKAEEPPAPIDYQGTLGLIPIVDGDRTLIEWFVEFDNRPNKSSEWDTLFLQLIPQWVDSLRQTLAGER